MLGGSCVCLAIDRRKQIARLAPDKRQRVTGHRGSLFLAFLITASSPLETRGKSSNKEPHPEQNPTTTHRDFMPMM
ncbi:hypothetical protein HaLaN_14115, partial [Haematococcus lacustris]